MPQEWTIRTENSDDIPFIYATWSNCIKQGSDLGRISGTILFFTAFHKLIDSILLKETCKIRVACLPDDPNVILGFLVAYPTQIHFIFVKQVFRGLGIGRALYEAAGKPLIYTMKTSLIEPLLTKMPGLIYNPFEAVLTFKQRGVNGTEDVS